MVSVSAGLSRSRGRQAGWWGAPATPYGCVLAPPSPPAFRCWGGVIWARSGENGICYLEALWTCNLAGAILCRFTCILHAF